MKKEKLDKNVRDQMLGLLPFDTNCEEKFTPSQFEKLDENNNYIFPKKYHPVFCITPWTQEEKDENQLLVEKLTNSKSSKEKKEINKDINECVRKKITNIENLFDMGKNDYVKCEKDPKLNCISQDMWKTIPVTIQNSIYFRLSNISGLTTNEMLGL
jgi:hypothetical protein